MRIHTILMLVLVAFMLSSCGAAADLNSCRKVADDFMARLAKRDFNGAYALCDPMALDQDVLFKIGNSPAYETLLDNYKGLNHGDGGQLLDGSSPPEVRLAPATPDGHDGFRVHFAFRKLDTGWKVIAFQIVKAE